MTPGVYNLDLYRGDTYTWRFALWEDQERVDPVDLSTAQVASQIRDKPGGATIVNMGIAITLPNIIDVDISADLWDGITISKGAWDLEVTYASGAVQTYVAGSVKVTTDVTNSTP
jgi:hypothetical protein